MANWHRIHWIGFVLSLAIGCLISITTILADQTANEILFVQMDNDTLPRLGEACGAGELMPDWVICLHGVVGVRDVAGKVSPIDNVLVSVTFNGNTVTGSTRLLPGETTPKYGIDISSLEPNYMQAVTITAVINNIPIQRQVIIAPDFSTQSQQFDVIIDETGALDAGRVWGYVVDFSANGPITGAVVTAESASASVSVTTTTQAAEDYPIYALDDTDLATLRVTSGDLVTVTAVYSDDLDQQTIILSPNPMQVNFVTGWKCDGFDPLPRSGSGDSLPRSGSGDSLPDIACFWGYALVDGVPMAGVDIHYEISGTTHTAVSRFYAGEPLPRYGLGMMGGQTITGSVVTGTAVYKGGTTNQPVSVTLDNNASQRTDFALTDFAVLDNFVEPQLASGAMVQQNNYLWVAVSGGVIRWNTNDNSFQQFTTADGLAGNSVRDIALANDNSVWFATNSGISHYTPGGTPEWESFTTTNGLTDNDVRSLAIAKDNSIWIGTYHGGANHLTPGGSPEWEYFAGGSGLGMDMIYSIAIANDDSVWFGGGKVSHYTPGGNPEWESFSMGDGLVFNAVNTIAIANDDTLWFGTDYGVSHFTPGETQEWTSFTTSDGLANDRVRSITIADDDSVWFGMASGGTRTRGGVTRLSLGETPEWTSFTPIDGLLNSSVGDIVISDDDSIWISGYGGIKSLYARE